MSFIGTGANQVPLNAHLGELAYLDKNQLVQFSLNQEIEAISDTGITTKSVFSMIAPRTGFYVVEFTQGGLSTSTGTITRRITNGTVVTDTTVTTNGNITALYYISAGNTFSIEYVLSTSANLTANAGNIIISKVITAGDF